MRPYWKGHLRLSLVTIAVELHTATASAATRHTIDLAQFADYCDIDPRYFERPYYLVPADKIAAEGYIVIREALRSSGKAGIGQMTMRGKESLVAIRPCGKGLLLETMRYAEELRKSDAVFADTPDIKPEKEMVDLATELIERKSGPFNPEAFKDHYREALRALVEEKRKHGRIVAEEEKEEPAPKGKVIDLMAALRASVGKKEAKPKPAPRKRRARG